MSVEDQLPIHEIKLGLSELDHYLESKPTKSEEWDRWVCGIHASLRKQVAQKNWTEAVRVAGAFVEMADLLGRKQRDGSLNLKYHMSSIVARYTS